MSLVSGPTISGKRSLSASQTTLSVDDTRAVIDALKERFPDSVADVLGVGSYDIRKALLERIDDGARVVDAERGLRDKGELRRVADPEIAHFLGLRDEVHLAVDP